MKKAFLFIQIFFLLLLIFSTLSSPTYSSNPLVVECQVQGKVLEVDKETLLVQIHDFDILYDKDECPVEKGDIFEISYTLLKKESLDIEDGDGFTAEVGRFWGTLESTKRSVYLNWYNLKDSEGNIIPLINPQSDAIPVDTEDLEAYEEGTTIIDEHTKEVSNRYFDLKLERKPQSAFGKHTPYILTITPHIDSKRTQILWNIPSGLKVKSKHKEFVSLAKGETYILKANIIPTKEGIFDFSVSALAWEHDTNYTNAVSDKIEFDHRLVLQPVSQQYQLMNILKYLLLFLSFGGLCFAIVKLSIKFSPKLKSWLTPPPM